MKLPQALVSYMVMQFVASVSAGNCSDINFILNCEGCHTLSCTQVSTHPQMGYSRSQQVIACEMEGNEWDCQTSPVQRCWFNTKHPSSNGTILLGFCNAEEFRANNVSTCVGLGFRQTKKSNCTIDVSPSSLITSTTDFSHKSFESTMSNSININAKPTQSNTTLGNHNNNKGIVATLAGGIGGVLVGLAIAVIILVVCIRRSRKTDSTQELGMDARPGVATATSNGYITNGEVQNAPLSVPTRRPCRAPDYEYIDIETLDDPQDKDMGNTVNALAVPERNLSVKETLGVVMEANDNYEGIGERNLSEKDTLGVVMEANDNYEGIGERNLSEKDTLGVVTEANDNYEGIGAMVSGAVSADMPVDVQMVNNAIEFEQRVDENLSKSDGLFLVDNAGYEGIGLEEAIGGK